MTDWEQELWSTKCVVMRILKSVYRQLSKEDH